MEWLLICHLRDVVHLQLQCLSIIESGLLIKNADYPFFIHSSSEVFFFGMFVFLSLIHI